MTRAGIQISSVRSYLQTPAGVLESFRKVSAVGYRVIQVQGIGPGIPAEFVRDALAETGLECAGTQDYYDVVAAQLDEIAAQNDLWGGASVCVSGIPGRYRSPEGCLAFAAELDALSRRLEGRGKTLAFHPRHMDIFPLAGRNSLALVMENTRAGVQLALDVYHLVKAGLDPVEWIRRAAGRCDLVHFKDMRVDGHGQEALVPTGQGRIAWRPVFRACAETGVRFGFAEQESWQKDPFECLAESYVYMVRNGIEP